MGAPIGGIHPTAVIGEPGEHRAHLERHVRFGVPERLRPIIHPSARISPFVTVDSGTFRATYVGPRAFLMAGCHVGHDCWIGPDVEISCLAPLGGETIVEAGAKLGLGAVTKPQVRIGTGAVIGAGAVVTRDVPPFEVWVGNPARKLRDVDEAYRYVSPDVVASPWSREPTLEPASWPEPACGVNALVEFTGALVEGDERARVFEMRMPKQYDRQALLDAGFEEHDGRWYRRVDVAFDFKVVREPSLEDYERGAGDPYRVAV